jgi:hypothetical protein
VLTWFWRQPGGRVEYTAEHVNIWADMVDRHLSMPHRLACVTDEFDGIDSRVAIINFPNEFADIDLPTWPSSDGKPQCMRRLSMFRLDAGEIFGARFVCMDLDCIISGSIDHLFCRTEDIVLYASPPGSPDGRPYNGSMLLMTAGARPQVYWSFTREGATAAGRRYAGSDQAWISHVLGGGEATWSERDGVTWWGRFQNGVPGCITFFPGAPKPWQLLDKYEWANRHYHRNHGGRCLVLEDGPSLWADVDSAIARCSVDAVIAMPEAAEHWPGDIAAIVWSHEEAEMTAASFGFNEIVFCGLWREIAA